MKLIDAEPLEKKFKGWIEQIKKEYPFGKIGDIDGVESCLAELENAPAISLDELTDSNRWISVSDRLPERRKTSCPRGNNPDFSNVSETVWICTQEGYTMEGTLEGDSWFNDMGQCLSDYFEDMAGHHVTHWMHLPKPPKGDVK